MLRWAIAPSGDPLRDRQWKSSAPFFVTAFARNSGNIPMSRALIVHLRTQTHAGAGSKMAEQTPARPGSPDFYHERAREMMKRAEDATTPDARASFLMLAANWENLARQIEHPGW
jgi:hypothetical protein